METGQADEGLEHLKKALVLSLTLAEEQPANDEASRDGTHSPLSRRAFATASAHHADPTGLPNSSAHRSISGPRLDPIGSSHTPTCSIAYWSAAFTRVSSPSVYEITPPPFASPVRCRRIRQGRPTR